MKKIKIMSVFFILIIIIMITGCSYKKQEKKDELKTNLIVIDTKVDSDFFTISGPSIGKAEDPIRIGFKTDNGIFKDNESLELEVLVGYFGDIRSKGLYPENSNLPKIVVRTNDNPVVEDDLVEIDNFLEYYRLKYITNEEDHSICGCKYVFPDDAKEIKICIDNEYFLGMFGEIRIGLYVGYMYKAESIYYCKNEENKTICISNISLVEAMKLADYDYVAENTVE